MAGRAATDNLVVDLELVDNAYTTRSETSARGDIASRGTSVRELWGPAPSSRRGARYGLAELALLSILFTDGMRVGLPVLRRAWASPDVLSCAGCPSHSSLTAVFAHVVAGVPWLEAFLLGAGLSPTDPAVAATIVGRR